MSSDLLEVSLFSMRRVLQVVEWFLIWFWFLGGLRLPRKYAGKETMPFVRPRQARLQSLIEVTQFSGVSSCPIVANLFEE